MRALMILLSVSSPILMAASCNVDRPDTNIYGVNVPGLSVRGYNLKKDYDDNGHRLPSAKPFEYKFKDEAEMLVFLNKATCTDPVGLAELQAFIEQLRKQYKGCVTQ